MIFKVRHEQRGGHIHCRLFAAKAPNMTYAGCGDFCVREGEFDDLQRVMSGVIFEDADPNAQVADILTAAGFVETPSDDPKTRSFNFPAA